MKRGADRLEWPPLSSTSNVMRLCVLCLVIATTAAVSAHDIPADVVVHAYLRPDGQRLHALIRVPLAAMRDVQFPLRGPGYLELAKADDFLRQAALTWVRDSLTLFEGGDRILEAPQLVAYRVSLPSDRSFATYDAAVGASDGPGAAAGDRPHLEPGAVRHWLDYPIRSDASEFAIHPGFARLGVRVATVLRFQQPDKPERVFEYLGDPGLVRLDPRWHQAALRFVALGFAHILDGIDHLLFLLCLVLPFRKLKPLVIIVTSFTVAHSITLIASAMDFAPGALWFPPLIETLIAASIVYMALENVIFQLLAAPPPLARRRSPSRSPRADFLALGSPSRSGWCTASASRSRCARRCSSRGRIC